MGRKVYAALSAADDFGQQRVSRKWFGDHGICLYHRTSQPGWPLNTITGTMRRGGGRPEDPGIVLNDHRDGNQYAFAIGEEIVAELMGAT
jgi:hypothetical protein